MACLKKFYVMNGDGVIVWVERVLEMAIAQAQYMDAVQITYGNDTVWKCDDWDARWKPIPPPMGGM